MEKYCCLKTFKRFDLLNKLLVMICFIPLALFSQDDSKPWERLGLSLTEWKLIQDNNMPMSKVEELLKAGIGISEYFRRPWEELGISEAKWIAKRREGLTNYDIELQVRNRRENTYTPADSEKNDFAFKDYDRSAEDKELFASFFLPGYVQLREKRKGRAIVMISAGVGSITGCTIWSIAQKQFAPLPLLVVLIPDMVWSLVDYKLHIKSR